MKSSVSSEHFIFPRALLLKALVIAKTSPFSTLSLIDFLSGYSKSSFSRAITSETYSSSSGIPPRIRDISAFFGFLSLSLPHIVVIEISSPEGLGVTLKSRRKGVVYFHHHHRRRRRHCVVTGDQCLQI